MSNDIIPTLSFEEKLKAKIKNDIGELLSDEDLQKMVKSSINSVFFDPRPNPKYKNSYYNNNEPATIDPLINELTKELLTTMVNNALNEWVKDHHEHVSTVIKQVIEQNAGELMVRAIGTMFQSPLFNMGAELQKVINKVGGVN